MENTSNLKLPLLVPNQSQKEITHNEALVIIDNILQNGVIDKDLNTPPENPVVNSLYIVGDPAVGEWAGQEFNLAFFDNGWRFIQAKEGFTFWVNDENCLYSFDGNNWVISSAADDGKSMSLSDLNDVILTSLEKNDILKYNGEKFINMPLKDGFGNIINPTQFDIIQHNGIDFVNTKSIQNISMLGIGANADENNKLSVKSDYVLFDKVVDSSRIKVNKATETDTSSHLFQNNYSGRAEFGLIGDDNFTLKVSNDGNSWNNAFVVDKITGNIDFKGEITQNGQGISSGPSSSSCFPTSKYIDLTLSNSGASYTSPDNGYFIATLVSTNTTGTIEIINNINRMSSRSSVYTTNATCSIFFPVRKNDVVNVLYFGRVDIFRFIYSTNN